MKRTRPAHGLAFSSLLMIVGLFPFGLLSPGAAPSVFTRTPTLPRIYARNLPASRSF